MRSLSIAGVVALTLCGLCGSVQAQRYTFHDYGQSDGLINLNTRCLLQDTIGFLWVCTEDGLFRFDGSSFERTPMDSRDATYVTGITQDAAGRIWDVSFTILPPWWRTRSMFVAEFTAAMLIFFLAWRWSVRVLVARQHRLEALVQERTQELEQEKAELLKTRAALVEQATRDSLTGLLNRAEIMHQLDLEMERARRTGSSLAFVLLDIDYFKQVNDTYGHVTGDSVLQEYAQRLRSAARPYDGLGRYGGEELVGIFPGLPKDGSEARLAGIHHALCTNVFHCNGHQLQVPCSLGVSWYRTGQNDARSLIERADQALYAAKAHGRNRVEVG